MLASLARALLIGAVIVAVLVFAMAAGRDDRLAAVLVDEVMEAVGAGAVGQKFVSQDGTDQINAVKPQMSPTA